MTVLAQSHLNLISRKTDVACIKFADLAKSGIKAVAFDKDNCLTAPYEMTLHPPFKVPLT
jgi:phosphatidylglycerophosphatase GEP4